MGTNFYLITADRNVCDEYFGYDYELTDTPHWGYQIHIAKTSAGWLPLWQSHDCFKSVKQLKKLYDTGNFTIADEYGNVYNWEEFDERVVQFNGGRKGVAPREKIEHNIFSPYYDRDMPEYRPISHFEYGHGKYANDYFTDEDGFEFTNHDFG